MKEGIKPATPAHTQERVRGADYDWFDYYNINIVDNFTCQLYLHYVHH